MIQLVSQRLRRMITSALPAAALLLGAPAIAGTNSANLGVSASVSANCLISTSAIAFGAYDPISANAAAALNGTGSVLVTCTQGAEVSISLDQGLSPEAGSTAAAPLRQMASGDERMSYALYSDSSRTAAWGADASAVSNTGNGAQQSLTVYGSIAAGQTALNAGNYADTVVATVSF